jgi:hypothetical protein
MFQNAILDIAIGLMLMYLVLSLVCTVINEFIATKLKLRAASLESGLKQLLDDPTVRNAFYSNGLIGGTSKSVARSSEALSLTLSLFRRGTKVVNPVDGKSRDATAVSETPKVDPATNQVAPKDPNDAEHPSYVSADTFTKALLGGLLGSLDPAKPVPGITEVTDAIKKLPASGLRDALQASLTTANNDLTQFRTEVAKWFDDSMERLGGAYKRQLKWISLIIGLAVAIIVNADSFEVGYALWSDSALRAQMVQLASETVKTELKDKPAQTPTDVAKAFQDANQTLRPLPIGWPLRTWPGKVDSTKANAATSKPPGETKPGEAKTDETKVAETKTGENKKPDLTWAWIWFVIAKVIGLIVTGVALSLGAPFWFDLLSKFINIRGTGTKPQRASN